MNSEPNNPHANQILSTVTTPFLRVLIVFLLCLVTLTGAAKAANPKPSPLQTSRADWMKYLPDTMQISQINLPGTFQSGSMKMVEDDDVYQTVLNSFSSQLVAGIRVFDLMATESSSPIGKYPPILCSENKGMYIDPHQSGDIRFSLENLLILAEHFVKIHPSETIILLVAAYDTRQNDQLTNLMNSYLYDDQKDIGSNETIRYYKAGAAVPALKDVRGKVILLWKDKGITAFENWYACTSKSGRKMSEKYYLLKHHLENNTVKQDFFGKNDAFSEKGIKNSLNSKDVRINAPFTVTTALTCYDPKDKFPDRNGFEYGWDTLYNKYKEVPAFKDITLNRKQRTGWWLLTFPQDHQVEEIIKSNGNVKKVKICVSNVKSADSQISIRIKTKKGYSLSVVNKEWIPEQGSERGTLSFDFGCYPSGEIIDVHSILISSPDMDIVFHTSKTVYPTDERIDEDTTYYYVMNPKSILKSQVLNVHFLDDQKSPELRPPEDPEAFLMKIGELGFNWDDENGMIRHIQISKAGKENGQLTSVKSVGETYRLTVSLQKYTNDFSEIQYRFNGLDLLRDTCPYKVLSYDESNLYLKLKRTNMKDYDNVPLYWFDGNDQYCLRQKTCEAILTRGVLHRAYDDRSGQLVTSENIRGTTSQLPDLKFSDNNTKLAARVFLYAKDYFPYRHEYQIPADLSWYQTVYNKNADGSDIIKLFLKAKMDFEIIWDDHNDALKKRPTLVNLEFTDHATQTDLEVTMDLRMSSGDHWHHETEMPIFTDDELSAEIRYDLGFSSNNWIRDYGYPEITCVKINEEKHPPKYVFTLTYHLAEAEDYTDIRGNITWYDGDLKVDHRSLNPEIHILRDGEMMTLQDSVLTLNDDCSKYRYIPITDFPSYEKGTEKFYRYDIDPQPMTNYVPIICNGYDLSYMRTVSISGTAEWQGKRPTQNQPIVQLLRDGQRMAECTQCVNDAYSFDQLPIASTDGTPYQYSVEIFLPETEYVIIYDNVMRDNENGNFTANATLIQPEHPVNAMIPVRLNLDGVEEQDVTEEFVFLITSEDDEDFEPQFLFLSRNNDFEGSFEIKNIQDNRTREYTVTQINLDRSPFWIYDDSIKTAAVTLRYIGSMTPVAEVDLGGDTKLNFTNIYVGEIPTKDLTVYVEWKDAEKYQRQIPDSVDIRLYENGRISRTATVTAADNWTCVFKDLPEYNVVPDNMNSRRLIYIDYDVDGTDVDEFTRTVAQEEEDTFVITYAAQTDLTTTDINVEIEWFLLDKGPDQAPDIPDQVKVTLYADEEATDKAKAKEKNDWTCVFKDKPVKDSGSGRKISYTVAGENIPGFTQQVRNKGTYSYVIAYRAIGDDDTIDITVDMKWLDTEKHKVTVPDHVTVTLYANGKVVKTKKAYFRESWECIFRKLPIYDETTGERIVYKITSEPLKNFKLSVHRRGPKTFEVTYQATEPLPPTGDTSNLLLFTCTLLMSLGLIFSLKRRWNK